MIEKTMNLNKRAAFIIIFLFLVFGVSLTAILCPVSRDSGLVADIYQDGELLTSIPLDGLDTPYHFTVTSENGGANEIEVRSHSIGIISADCPDKLCIHHGFIDHTGLPIVCLPNRLVIQLRERDSVSIDATAY